MDFLKLAEERFSVRKFTGEPLKKEDIEKILKAAHLAPTGCNFQPFRILVIESEEAIGKLKNATRSHFDAPTAMLICYNRDECWRRPYDGAESGIYDAAIVTTHMMLEAKDIGVGSTWVMHFNPEKMKEEFNIPENIVPAALLVMGYPADDCTPHPYHSTFRDKKELVFYNRF